MDVVVRFVADGMLFVIIIVGGATMIMTLKKRIGRHIPIMVMAGLSSLLVGKLFSLAYQPDSARPFIEAGVAAGASYIDNPGFPSDHALLGAVVVVAVYALCVQQRTIAHLLAIMLVVMCVGRVVALVHTPLDVIGGLIAGLSGGIWYKKLTH